MACEENGMSDERIGEALIGEVFREELGDEQASLILPVNTDLKSKQEEKIVTQLGQMIRIIGDRVKDDKEFQDAIDGMAKGPGTLRDKFLQLVAKVFEHGQITWERIAVLFYVAGKMAVRMMGASLPQSVKDILSWTVDFFKTKLLGWIHDHGGWINSFSELASVPLRGVSCMSSNTTRLTLIFIAGLALGSIITWKLAKRT